MKQCLCIILALWCLIGCSKHQNKPPSYGDTRLTVTVETSVGAVIRSSFPDTFLIKLKDPSKMGAVPVLFHIAEGATVDVGTRIDDTTWTASLDLSQNSMRGVTVTAQSGQTYKYVIAYQYIINNYLLITPTVGKTTYDIAVEGNTICVGTVWDISISTDRGITFKSASIAGSGANCVAVQNGVIYAGTNTGEIAISKDGGQSFTMTQVGSQGQYLDNLTGIRVQGDTVYATCYLSGLHISYDKGNSFVNSSTGLGTNPLGLYVQGNTIYVATQAGLSISPGAGASFTNYTNVVANGQSPSTYAVFAQNGTIYAGTNFGLQVSTNGGQSFAVYPAQSGWPNKEVNDICVHGDTICVATGDGLELSTDGGASFSNFTDAAGFSGDVLTAVTMSGNSIYIGNSGGSVNGKAGGLTIMTARP